MKESLQRMRVKDKLSKMIVPKESLQCIEHSSPYTIAKLELMFIIKEFLCIFGTQTTTNHDLKRYAKMLGIKNFYIVMSDEVNELPENNFSAILNFQLSSETGSHWVALYRSHDRI